MISPYLPPLFMISVKNSKKWHYFIKTIQPFPFPNRSSCTLDSFGQKAWNALKQNPRKTYSQVETIAGKQTVRVALADTMVAQGCVDCHNSHPEPPKTGWSSKDVHGVLEVQIPFEEQLNSMASINMTIAVIVILTLCITAGI